MMVSMCETCGAWQEARLVTLLIQACNMAFQITNHSIPDRMGIPCPHDHGPMICVSCEEHLSMYPAIVKMNKS